MSAFNRGQKLSSGLFHFSVAMARRQVSPGERKLLDTQRHAHAKEEDIIVICWIDGADISFCSAIKRDFTWRMVFVLEIQTDKWNKRVANAEFISCSLIRRIAGRVFCGG